MAKAQADRKAAAKKAAVTRERNKSRAKSQSAGEKAASTRRGREALEDASRARGMAGQAAGTVVSAGKLAGGAAIKAGRSLLSRGKAGSGKR